MENISERHSLTVLGVALSFWNPRGKSNNTFLDIIETTFPGKILQAKVRRDIAVSEASVHGKSIFEISPKSRAAEDYSALAKELLKRLREVAACPK
jgi:chromosome partitioning protein